MVYRFSGITSEMLENVTTTRKDIQEQLKSLITPSTILVGQSLNSDLNALHYSHPYIIDTACIYEHPRGPPNKPGLKWLAQKYLNLEIQQGAHGHDSVEDARTCLNLLKRKLERGLDFGTAAGSQQSIFTSLSSARPISKTGAVIDYGDPARRWGASAQTTIACQTDDEMYAGVTKCANGDVLDGTKPVDFVWGQATNLYKARGWNTSYQQFTNNLNNEVITASSAPIIIPPAPAPPPTDVISAATESIVQGIMKVYEELPKCTAFIVYSGTGNPIEMGRLNAIQTVYRKEFKVKKWDQCSVKWTDTEEQALKKAAMQARAGTALLTVK